MRQDDNIENHIAINTPDAPWNQPDAPEETAVERMEREKLEAAATARTEFCDALVEIAEFLESHPDVPLPFGYLTQTASSREEFLKAAAVLARGGNIEKKVDGAIPYAEYRVIRAFGPIHFNLRISRNLVCRLVSPAVYDCPDILEGAGKEFEEAK